MGDGPRRYEVKILQEAMDDIRSIRDYIEEQLCNRAAATRTVEAIFATARALETFPFRNRSLGSCTSGFELGLARSGNYVLLYVVDGERVKILAVLYGKSDLESRIENLLMD